ncbi:hypothetical protein TNCV_2845291 [Trichonephila clavipes]|nr:hypothetical protein TNCV_2845291 [Trichonephila clavipes]
MDFLSDTLCYFLTRYTSLAGFESRWNFFSDEVVGSFLLRRQSSIPESPLQLFAIDGQVTLDAIGILGYSATSAARKRVQNARFTQLERKRFPIRNPVSLKTIQRELHAVNFHGKVDIPKSLVLERNAMKRLYSSAETPYTEHNCNGNNLSGLMNPPLIYSKPPDRCSSGEHRQKHFMLTACSETCRGL